MVAILSRVGVVLWVGVVTYVTATLAYGWYVVLRARSNLIDAFDGAQIGLLVLIGLLAMVAICALLSAFFYSLLVRLGLALLISGLVQGGLSFTTGINGGVAALALLIMAMITFVIHQMTSTAAE